MRILQVGKFHFPQGGADKYFLDLSSQLEARGHSVAHFSLHHPKNVPSRWSVYFAPPVYFTGKGVWQTICAIGRRIFSGFASRRLFAKLVRDFRPDIIHVHNICHYLSPSFLSVARQYQIPVVMHLHDYSFISPNYLLFDARGDYHGGKEQRYFECIKDRCFRNSYVASFLVALEMYWHHRVLKIFEKNVTAFVAPSLCMREQMRLWRPDIHNIQVIPHGVVIQSLKEENPSISEEQYFLYVGRLSTEKGIQTLLSTFAQLTSSKETTLKIVGDGPERRALETLAKELGIEKMVVFLGFKNSAEIATLIEKSVALIVPSEWKEVFGLVVIEGMERGKVVIASRTGGIPEIIEDKKTGLLFTKGNALELTNTMKWVLENEVLSSEIGKRARVQAVEQYSSLQHISAIEKLYQDILKR